MQKSKWPGIATAVAIVLILTLIVVGSRDDFHLKDWQPLMAAVVALAGGALAYGAAMAKVNLDAEQNRRAVLRKQISLFLKLQIATLGLRDASLLILLSAPARGEDDEMKVSEIDIEIPSDLAEVWENLDVFPVPLIRELAIIRESLHHISNDLRKVPPDEDLRRGRGEILTALDEIIYRVGQLANASATVYELLGPEIDRIAPRLPEEQRKIARVGDLAHVFEHIK